jgi:6-phosphofructokinase 1
MRLFNSYNFNDDLFVRRVSYHLSKQEGIEPYCWSLHGRADETWLRQLSDNLSKCDVFLLFLGKELGRTQVKEANAAILSNSIIHRILIKIGDVTVPDTIEEYSQCTNFPVSNTDEDGALECAKNIVTLLGKIWINPFEIPVGYPFDYEKSIIKEYLEENKEKKQGVLSNKRVQQGCPREWPRVKKNDGESINPVEESIIGVYRDWDYTNEKRKIKEPEVIPVALTEYHSTCPIQLRLTFPEAGPRKFLYYPTKKDKKLTVGVLVSGGIAPGINAVIDGIVERQYIYANKGRYSSQLSVLGYLNGFDALLQTGSHYQELDANFIGERVDTGGSILGSSRAEELVDPSPSRQAQALITVAQRLLNDGVEILYIIGGHGSMRAAHAIWKAAQEISKGENSPQLSVVAVPKTMDNDIFWVWQSFGFMSAVERAKELIGYMYTEVKSNPGLCVIQLFGSDSGFVSSHTVLSSGLCDLCLIPEVPFTMKEVSSYVTKRLKDRSDTGSPYSIIVASEAAVPQDAVDYLEDADIGLTPEEKKEIRDYLKNGRLSGHTPDPLRKGTLKVITGVLEKNIRKMHGEQWQRFRVITNEPKHQIRAIPPSPSDTIFGRRLGSLAVDCAMAGYTDFMISQWLTEYVMVPLRLVILGRKRVPKQGIFWNSVRHSTGQPEDLEE